MSRKLETLLYLRRLSEHATLGSVKHLQMLREEDRLAEVFSTVFLNEPLTSAMKHYLSLLSLPFVLGPKPSIDMEAIWLHRLKQMWPLSWQGGMTVFNQQQYAEMPAGNMQPIYMFVGDAPYAPRHDRHFRRAFTYGRTNLFLKSALFDLDILHQSWFTLLSKVPLTYSQGQFEDFVHAQQQWLKNEINILQPQKIILLGRRVKTYFPFEHETITVYHPRYPLTAKHSRGWYLVHLKEMLCV